MSERETVAAQTSTVFPDRRSRVSLSAHNSDPNLRLKQAEAIGLNPVLSKKGRRTGWLEENRPNVTTLVACLMGDNELGTTLYNYLSAVAHSSSWGLTQTMGPVEAHPSGRGHLAPIVVNLDFVRTIAGTVALAHTKAVRQTGGSPSEVLARVRVEPNDIPTPFRDGPSHGHMFPRTLARPDPHRRLPQHPRRTPRRRLPNGQEIGDRTPLELAELTDDERATYVAVCQPAAGMPPRLEQERIPLADAHRSLIELTHA